jgi:Holliday junction resolvasome RuvABC endonuclease subunit
MRPLAIIGLDPSLTSFGIARTSGPDCLPDLHRVRPKTRGHERLALILREVERLAFGADLAVIEGAVLVAAGGGESRIALAGLHWQVRHRLWEIHVPYAVVPPATRIKYLTGTGNAPKDMCLAATIRLFPLADVDGNDKADALALAQMGADAHGEPLVPVPKDRTALLHAKRTVKNHRGEPVIDWPAINREDVLSWAIR